MYGKGDYISYGGHGVCRIADVRSMDFGSGEQEYLVIERIALLYANGKYCSECNQIRRF